jgi:hypothetical protein
MNLEHALPMRISLTNILFTLAVLGLCAVAGCGGVEPRDEPEQNMDAPMPATASESTLSGTLVGGDPVVLSERPVDLAILDTGEVANRVIVPTMAKSNGRREILWAPQESGLHGEAQYWTSGAVPSSWLELKLDRPAYVSEVILYPLSQHYGLSEFSLQIMARGQTVDTFPRTALAAPPVADPDYDRPAASLRARFQPKLAEKLRFRFTKGAPRPKTSSSWRGYAYWERLRNLASRAAKSPFLANAGGISSVAASTSPSFGRRTSGVVYAFRKTEHPAAIPPRALGQRSAGRRHGVLLERPFPGMG